MSSTRTERDHRRQLLEQAMRAVLLQVQQHQVPLSQKQLECLVATQTELPLTVIRQSIWRLLSSGVLRFTPEEGNIAAM